MTTQNYEFMIKKWGYQTTVKTRKCQSRLIINNIHDNGKQKVA